MSSGRAEAAVLIIGGGSIGVRHSRALSELQTPCAFVSRHIPSSPDVEVYPSIQDGLRTRKWTHAVVANETHRHADTIRELAACGFRGRVLVEKPLNERVSPSAFLFRDVYVGYNLRFHPVVQELKKFIENHPPLVVRLAVGQYLPSWRPDRDYRETYSADRRRGGGVLRDLSHELDLALLFGGNWLGATGLFGQWGNLQISSEDSAELMLECERARAVSISLSYLSRMPRRTITVESTGGTAEADLIAGRLSINGDERSYEAPRDFTYQEEWRDLLQPTPEFACTADEANSVFDLIERLEGRRSAQTWVTR